MYIIIFIGGTCIGSFLNVLIYRIRNKKGFITGRSFCPKCKHKLAWYDNIPLLGFILLKARCRYCREKISFQYPLIELATGILFMLAFFRWQAEKANILNLVSYFIFTSILIVIFVYDFKWYLILDKISIPAIIIALFLNIFLGGSILNLLLAGAVAGGFFLAQFFISGGRWIGGGDIRLGFLMGIMLGWPNILTALFIAYIFGAIAGIFLILVGKKKMQSKLPFGTFLTFATFIAMLWGQKILAWYINYLSKL